MTTFCTKCNQPLLGGSPLCSNCGYDNAAGAYVQNPGQASGQPERPRPVHHEHVPTFGGIQELEGPKTGKRVLIAVIVLTVLGIGGYGFWSWNRARLSSTISWASPPHAAQGLPAGGFDFSCALTEEGKALCWGNSDAGQLGDTTPVLTAEPLTVRAPGKFVALDAGDNHACGLTDVGNVYCWGSDAKGQLGVPVNTLCRSEHGSIRCSALPVQAPVGGVRWIATGGTHTCVLDANGNAVCWGSNVRGQLGTADSPHGDSILVTHVDKKFKFWSIAAGGAHTCAITNDYSLMCWGWNRYGELGSTARMQNCVSMGATTPCAAAPVPSATGIKFMQVALGRDHTCGLSRDGIAYCWGLNMRGQVGNGRTSDSVQAPTPVLGDRRYIAIGAGQDYSCAIERGGAVWCWGDAAYHQLGTADSTFSATPVKLPLTQPALSIGVGGNHACVVTVSKQVICWGAEDMGQLGKGPVGLGDTRLREAGPTGTQAEQMKRMQAQPASRQASNN